MKHLKEKVVVITGAGSGIGRALALELEKEGCLLSLMDYNESTLLETVSLLENKSVAYTEVFDVSDLKAFEQFANRTISHFGKVDVVINNAGVALATINVLETTYEQYEWMLKINLWGVIYGTKIFLPHLLERPEASILNVSSCYGLIAMNLQSAYTTSKFAVRGFTESLRNELVGSNVTASCVYPGGVGTNIARNAKGWNENEKEQRVKQFDKLTASHTSEQAARTIIKGLRSKNERIMVGKEAYLIDMVARVLPSKYSYLTKKIADSMTAKD